MEEYYHDETTGECELCPDSVSCGVHSTIADWVLKEGYWRAGAYSKDVMQCRFREISCPGSSIVPGKSRVLEVPPSGCEDDDNDDTNYCACGFIGPLCSQCADGFFMSWAGAGGCKGRSVALCARHSHASPARHSRVTRASRIVTLSRRGARGRARARGCLARRRRAARLARVANCAPVGAAPARGADGEDAAPTVVTYYE